MANSNADQQLVDQVVEAFSVPTTKVAIQVSDKRINVASQQNDDADPTKLVHTFQLSTTSSALITAIVEALQSTGRP